MRTGDRSGRPIACWPQSGTHSAQLQAAARAAIEQGSAFLHRGLVTESGTVEPMVAAPVVNGGRTMGAVAVALREASAEGQARALHELQQAIEQLIPTLAALSNEGAASDAAQILQLQATILAQARFEESASAFASELASIYQLDRVTVGFLDQAEMRLVAVSHGAELKPRQDLYRAIAAAMSESVQHAATVAFPPLPDTKPQVTLAHAELKNRIGSAVCSIPIANQGEVIGAVTIERNVSHPMRASEIASIEHAVCLAGPVLGLARRAERGPFARAKEMLQSSFHRTAVARTVGKSVAVVGVFATFLAGALVPVPYHVSAPARLEGAIQRSLVAPVDGFLEEAHVRPGDKIEAGQVLVQLAQRDLLLERRKWESEHTQHENAYGAALARADRALFVVNRAKASEAQAQIALIDEQLERSRIVAPFAGIVISGDLTQMLGAPVKIGETLLSVAPANAYRLMIELDERDVREVAIGSSGQVVLSALPGDRVAIEVVRTTPVAQTRDGRHFFEVEARLAQTITGLRPGLAGVAKLQAEARPLVSAMLHRVFGWLSLTWWRWS
jgi:multidrug efflux pump subunit AcrA (membrane-fusion protein)